MDTERPRIPDRDHLGLCAFHAYRQLLREEIWQPGMAAFDLDHHERLSGKADHALAAHPPIVVHAFDRDELPADLPVSASLSSHPLEELERDCRGPGCRE